MSYDFQPRIPLDHVVTLVGILRGTVERERGDVLILCGATLGEAGALLKQGLVVTTEVDDGDFDSQVEQLEVMLLAAQTEASVADMEVVNPTFDITPFIPIILKIIEMILNRRRG